MIIVGTVLTLAGLAVTSGEVRRYWDHQRQLVYSRALVAQTAIELRRRLEEWPSGHTLPALLCGPESALVPTGLWPPALPTRQEEMFGRRLTADGWGRCLIMNLNDSNLLRPVWVISAGPDGRIQTTAHSRAREGDDIAVRVR